MELNLHIDHITRVKIRGKEYPVLISGNGIACLSIGIGTLGQRTLSERFKKQFKVYSTDLYWDASHALDNPEQLTMNQMLDDIAELGHQLHLYRFVIFGHSAFGIVALEFAKKYPHLCLAIIMVGTPLNSNAQVAARNDAYFQTHADSTRKQIDAQRRQEIAHQDMSSMNPSEILLREFVYRDAPRYWHIPDFDCSQLWQGIVMSNAVNHLFADIFPAIDVFAGLEKVSCPIFLAAGSSDYDCCPFFWTEVNNLPSRMVISQFQESGHWPHYEQQDLFDERIELWVKENITDFK